MRCAASSAAWVPVCRRSNQPAATSCMLSRIWSWIAQNSRALRSTVSLMSFMALPPGLRFFAFAWIGSPCDRRTIIPVVVNRSRLDRIVGQLLDGATDSAEGRRFCDFVGRRGLCAQHAAGALADLGDDLCRHRVDLLVRHGAL